MVLPKESPNKGPAVTESQIIELFKNNPSCIATLCGDYRLRHRHQRRRAANALNEAFGFDGKTHPKLGPNEIGPILETARNIYIPDANQGNNITNITFLWPELHNGTAKPKAPKHGTKLTKFLAVAGAIGVSAAAIAVAMAAKRQNEGKVN
jgi:hypothetical protein